MGFIPIHNKKSVVGKNMVQRWFGPSSCPRTFHNVPIGRYNLLGTRYEFLLPITLLTGSSHSYKWH